MIRRAIVAATALIGGTIAGAAMPAGADQVTAGPDRPAPIDDGGPQIDLAPFATIPDASDGGPPRLLSMATQGDRLFVVEQYDGVIYELVDRETNPRAVRYFDVGAAVEASTGRVLDDNAFHGGLRSVAFHPDFAIDGKLYVSAMEERPASSVGHTYLSDVAAPIEADSVLLEFTADPSTGAVNPASYREVFRVGMPVYDHPIKQIAFGPQDGLLYIAHGDGSEWSATAGGGQRDDALGKVLRIDPLAADGRPYRVPADNPFVDDPSMLDEVFTLGHRNPHTLAFGTVAGSTVLISSEPGRDNVEEINLLVAGDNYGWSLREGTFVHNNDTPGVGTGVGPLPGGEASNGFTYPAAQYGHSGEPGDTVTGESVAGGYLVANGSELSGRYLAADFPRSGELYTMQAADLFAAVTQGDADQLTQARIRRSTIAFDHDGDPGTAAIVVGDLAAVVAMAPTYSGNRADIRFGQGPDGEVYVTSKQNNRVYLVTNSVAAVEPGTIAEATTLDEILAATDYRASDADTLRLYRAFFARTPDVVGVQYWLAQSRNGVDLDTMAWSFASSAEFEATYGQVDDERFIEIVYDNVLGRVSDPAGRAYWLDQVRRGVLPRHGVVRWVAAGAEFINRYPYAPVT